MHKFAIEVSSLIKNFGRTKAVDNISFNVELGSITALLGGNGAGKSTTLKSISNLLASERGEVTKGSVTYSNEYIHDLDPAQLVKKYDCEVVPIYIERYNKNYFKMNVEKPLIFRKDSSLDDITLKLNKKLELMILRNPDQWIWSHDRWK